MNSPADRRPQRYIIAVGVDEYDDDALRLQFVADDVASVLGWFEDHCGKPHRRALSNLSASPTVQDIRQNLSDWFMDRLSTDIVIMYYTGHGAIEGGKTYLMGRDSPRKRLAGRALAAEELGRIIGQSSPHNVLVIIDACVAGRLAAEVQEGVERTSDELGTRSPDVEWSTAVVSASFGRFEAYDGHFTKAFLEVVNQERWTGTISEWITIDQLIEGLNAELAELPAPQVAERRVWGTGPIRLVPNPNWGRRPPSALIPDEERLSHWEPRSRGALADEGSVTYFRGRSVEMRRIRQWLTSSDRGVASGLFVITGSPGSGKSALVARTLLESQPGVLSGDSANMTLEEKHPPASSIDAVVWCREKTLTDVVETLGQSLGTRMRTAADVVTHVGEERFALVVDALDEAVGSEANKIAVELLRPLSLLPNAKVLVATRKQLRRGSGHAVSASAKGLLEALGVDHETPVIDLDLADDQRDDMLDAVVARLMHPSGYGHEAAAYRDDPKLAHAVANRIVDQAGRSFLVASLTARSLTAEGSTIDPTDPHLSLPAAVGEAVGRYLDRLPDSRRVREVLRPLAWSEGAGLTWAPLWSHLASALSNDATQNYSDSDIGRVLDLAGDLVVESIDFGQPVYRLFHEALAENLRADTEPSQAHEAMVSAMRGYVRKQQTARPWTSAPVYIRAHIASHAMLVPNALDRMLKDPDFIIAAHPTSLLRALRSVPAGDGSGYAHRVAQVYELASSGFGKEWGPEERAVSLEYAARSLGFNDVASSLRLLPNRAVESRFIGLPLEISSHRIPAGRIDRLTVGTLRDGRRVAVASSYVEGFIRMWDIDSLQPLPTPLLGRMGSALEMSVASRGDGSSVLIARMEGGTIYAWSLDTGENLGPVAGDEARIRFIAPCAAPVENSLFVTVTEEGLGQMWDASTLGESGHAVRLGPRLTGVALYQDSNADMMIAGVSREQRSTRWGYRLDVWRALDGQHVKNSPMSGLNLPGPQVALFRDANGRQLLFNTSADAITVYDALTGSLIFSHFPFEAHQLSITTRRNGAAVLVSVGEQSQAVQIHDLRILEAASRGDDRDIIRVWTAEGTRHDSNSVWLGADHDHTLVRSRIPEGSDVLRRANAHRSRIQAIDRLQGREGKPDRLVTGGADGHVTFWDSGSLTRLETSRISWHGIRAVVVTEGTSQSVTIVDGKGNMTSHSGGHIATAKPASVLKRGVQSACPITMADDSECVVLGYESGVIEVWDPTTNATIMRLGKPGFRSISSVSAFKSGENVLLATVGGYSRGAATVWTVNEGSVHSRSIATDFATIRSLALGRLGQWGLVLVAAGVGGGFALWDLVEGTCRISLPLTAHCISMDSNGQSIFVGGQGVAILKANIEAQ